MGEIKYFDHSGLLQLFIPARRKGAGLVIISGDDYLIPLEIYRQADLSRINWKGSKTTEMKDSDIRKLKTWLTQLCVGEEGYENAIKSNITETLARYGIGA